MSIRYIAVELYRLERDVERLKKELENAPANKRDEIDLELKRAVAERDRYRDILESKKEKPANKNY